ncbi:MAG TPA: glycogen synthase, partial [Pseudomonadales bacterium]|nr:glycogen synthase [Pseudomonadales bacterium]
FYSRTKTLFTIHNLAYQGLFSRAQFNLLDLPESAWSIEGVEYYGQLSFIKAGINCSDWISTVSPTYAREITTFAYGCGLDGLLRARQGVLVGILNGIDAQVWNPATDPLIPHHYSADELSGKRLDKVALLRRMGLPADDELPLLAMVTRLVEQKGIDLLLEILPWLMTQPLRLVVLGNGDPHYTELLLGCARRHPDRLAVVAGYDEPLAHQIEAGADLFVMPSRFEPCGLNQLYSLRYGTLPLVRRVGGLADTVIDADAATEGNGFCFDFASGPALRATLERALALYHQPARWQQLMRSAMAADFSWQRSSADYLALYRRMLAPQ